MIPEDRGMYPRMELRIKGSYVIPEDRGRYPKDGAIGIKEWVRFVHRAVLHG